MGGEKAQLCFTDPPYGANIEYATHEDSQENLRKLVDGFFPLAEECSELIALSPGINNMWLYKKPSWAIGWFYSAGSGRTPWGFSAWQPILVFGKDPKLAAGEGCHPDGFQLLMSKEDAEENRKLGHVVPKPLSVWERLMERLSNKYTSVIYEPFCGSGTTIVVCQNAGHKCRAIELDPSYVAVALERMSQAFPELEIRRLP
jgi:DNA modification methylase